MADWSLIETTVAAWLTSITGLPTRWTGRPVKPTFSSNGYLVLSKSAVKTVGSPTLTEAWDDEEDEVTYTSEASVSFTLGVKIVTQRASVDHDAQHFASLIMDRLFLRMTTGEVLDAADIAVARVLGDTPIGDQMIDGREMSVHQLDLRLNATASVSDTPVETIRTIVDAEADVPSGTTVWSGDITIG